MKLKVNAKSLTNILPSQLHLFFSRASREDAEGEGDQAAVEVSTHIQKQENQLSSLLGPLAMSGHALRAQLRKC